MSLELLSEPEARLLDVPLSDKLYYLHTLCVWCYHVGKTIEGKEIYFHQKDAKKLKEIFNDSHNPSHTICQKDFHKHLPELRVHLDYLEDRI